MTDQERYHSARRDTGLVVIEGFHAFKHALRFGAAFEDIVTDDPAALAALAADLAPDLVGRIAALPCLRTVARSTLDALAPSPNPTRVIALAVRPVHDIRTMVADVVAPASGHPLVVLDQPRHAGNVGAAIRVAAAAGAAGLITTGPADPWSAAAVRGAAGLQFALPVARVSTHGTHGIRGTDDTASDRTASTDGEMGDGMRALLGTSRYVIAVDPAGHDMDASAAVPGRILLFGSERDGISAALLARADRRVRIPMRPAVSSLNLATAVAVMLYCSPDHPSG